MTILNLLVLTFSTFFCAYIARVKHKEVDIFNPANIFFLWQFINLLSVYLFYMGGVELISNIENAEFGLSNFIVVLVLYQLTFAITYILLPKSDATTNKSAFEKFNINHKITRVKVFLFVIFFIFLLAIFSLIIKFSSVINLVMAMAQRGNVLAIAQLEFSLIFITSFMLAVLITFFWGDKLKLVSTILLLLFSLVAIFTGSRAFSFLLIIVSVVVYHYNYRNFKFKFNYILLLLLGIFIFITMQLLRSKDAVDIYSNDFNQLLHDVLIGLGGVIARISLLNENIFIYSEYGLDNLWLGYSYFDLMYYPVPRSYYPLKPPIDEGVYVYSKYLGFNSTPSMPMISLFPSSWPLKTESAMYINFWYLGVVIGGFVTAVIYDFIYKRMILAKGRIIYLFWLPIYCYLVFGKIQLTNLGFANLVPLIFSFLALVIFLKPSFRS